MPPGVTAGLDTVAVRIPAHPVAHALLAAARIPIAAPSANLFSRPSPTRVAHVLEDLDGRIDLVVDAGSTDVGVESTVLDLTVNPPLCFAPALYAGSTAIGSADGPDRFTSGRSRSHAVARPLAEHYAPRAPMTLFQGSRPPRVVP